MFSSAIFHPFEFLAGLWGLLADPEMRYSSQVFLEAEDPTILMKQAKYNDVDLRDTYN